MFRRVNSYNVPLNNEEKRHAKFQGPFKWFIHAMSSAYDTYMIELGVLTQRQVFRMTDTKLFTDVVRAMEQGIKTSSPRELDRLYADSDTTYPDNDPRKEVVDARLDALRARMDAAIEFILSLTTIHRGPLMKEEQFYSLLLAVSHFQNPMDSLSVVGPPGSPRTQAEVEERLSALAAAAENAADSGDLDEDDDPGQEAMTSGDDSTEDSPDFDPPWSVPLSDIRHYARASGSGTNTVIKRTIRFRFLYDALCNTGLR